MVFLQTSKYTRYMVYLSIISGCQGNIGVIKVIQSLCIFYCTVTCSLKAWFGKGSWWYKTHNYTCSMIILVFYAIYMQLPLVLVPVYFMKHSISCYVNKCILSCHIYRLTGLSILGASQWTETLLAITHMATCRCVHFHQTKKWALNVSMIKDWVLLVLACYSWIY